MPRLFGTDGVRGLANKDLTAQLALDLGEAAARGIGHAADVKGRKPRAVVGCDTRISGEFLDHAITAGLASSGIDVVRIGVVSTPVVAHLTATAEDIDLGVMISASHNPMPDNGIKFFGHGGFKLPDAVEDKIESLIGQEWDRPIGGDVGEVHWEDDWAARSYIKHLVKAVGISLKGLRVAVDCANGGASELGPQALRECGVDVVAINASPDGLNINDMAGSTHPEQLQAATVAAKADFGIAYDGDADRCLAVGPDGALIDGDQIMGALAVYLRDKGELKHDTLVVTVMSNLGLLLAMRDAGISTVQTGVGDRYVLEAMQKDGYSLGGEQSGHVIAKNYATTGDGILTSLLIAKMVKETGKTLEELVSFVKRLPQTLVNVPDVDKSRVDSDAELQAAVKAAEEEMGDTGRVLLRSSGTEPLVRVMVEAATQADADRIAGSLADVVKERLAL